VPLPGFANPGDAFLFGVFGLTLLHSCPLALEENRKTTQSKENALELSRVWVYDSVC
jgi:hypothetical protein